MRGVHHRAAFTLVELMMSLIIIGMLTTLLGVAVSFAINAAKNTAIKADLANLDQALQSYKNNYGSEYPTCMAIPAMKQATTTPTSPSRVDLFNRSLRKRFPRCTNQYVQGWTQSSTSPDVGNLLYNNWYVRDLSNPNPSSITTSNTIPLNLDNMDAAESLVFWLAGPPTPADFTLSTPQFVSPSVLWGFCADPTKAFAPKGSRLPFLYEFDESRLTDIDHDGWPEYAPKATSSKTIGTQSACVPPFVYFEPNSYTYNLPLFGAFVASYPGAFVLQSGSTPYSTPHPAVPSGVTNLLTAPPPQTTSMLSEWGFAMPYANSYTTTLTAWNPKKFQLITGGLDCEYGGSQYEVAGTGRQFVAVVPQTSAQSGSTGTQYLTQGDNDNLTNFIDSKVEDYVPQ